MLSAVDSGSPEGLHAWCQYVLDGILVELGKVDRLTNYDYLKSSILDPALRFAKGRQLLTETELKILRLALEKNGTLRTLRAGDLSSVNPEWVKASQQPIKLHHPPPMFQ